MLQPTLFGSIPPKPDPAFVSMFGLRFRTPPVHGSLSLVSVVCRQVEVSTTGRLFFQGIPTDCDASGSDRGTHRVGHGTLGLLSHENSNLNLVTYTRKLE